jgi:hypothetical protein
MLFLYIQKPVEYNFLTPVLPCDFGNTLYMLYKGSSLQVGFMKSRYWPGLVVHRFGLVIFGSMLALG